MFWVICVRHKTDSVHGLWAISARELQVSTRLKLFKLYLHTDGESVSFHSCECFQWRSFWDPLRMDNLWSTLQDQQTKLNHCYLVQMKTSIICADSIKQSWRRQIYLDEWYGGSFKLVFCKTKLSPSLLQTYFQMGGCQSWIIKLRSPQPIPPYTLLNTWEMSCIFQSHHNGWLSSNAGWRTGHHRTAVWAGWWALWGRGVYINWFFLQTSIIQPNKQHQTRVNSRTNCFSLAKADVKCDTILLEINRLFKDLTFTAKTHCYNREVINQTHLLDYFCTVINKKNMSKCLLFKSVKLYVVVLERICR